MCDVDLTTLIIPTPPPPKPLLWNPAKTQLGVSAQNMMRGSRLMAAAVVVVLLAAMGGRVVFAAIHRCPAETCQNPNQPCLDGLACCAGACVEDVRDLGVGETCGCGNTCRSGFFFFFFGLCCV